MKKKTLHTIFGRTRTYFHKNKNTKEQMWIKHLSCLNFSSKMKVYIFCFVLFCFFWSDLIKY